MDVDHSGRTSDEMAKTFQMPFGSKGPSFAGGGCIPFVDAAIAGADLPFSMTGSCFNL